MADEHDVRADALAFNMMLSIVNEWHRQVGIDEVMKTKLTRAIADTVATRCVREVLAAALREAVAAERKRCAEVARNGMPLIVGLDTETRETIAAAIEGD